MDRFVLLAVQGTLKSLLQHHNSKASILWRSAFLIVQLSLPYIITGKTIALTMWTYVRKMMSLLFKMLSRFVIALVPSLKSESLVKTSFFPAMKMGGQLALFLVQLSLPYITTGKAIALTMWTFVRYIYV